MIEHEDWIYDNEYDQKYEHEKDRRYMQPKMKKVKIYGDAVVVFTQTLLVPENEISDLISSEDSLTMNVDIEEAQKEIIEWKNIHAFVEQ